MPLNIRKRARYFGCLFLVSTLLATPMALADYSDNSRSFKLGRTLLPAREEACTFIAQICGQGLIAYSRNPSLLPQLGEIVLEAQDKFLSLNLNRCDRHHVGAAIGYIAGANLVATARNPSLKDNFKIVVEFCEEALHRARQGNPGVDVEGLIEALQ